MTKKNIQLPSPPTAQNHDIEHDIESEIYARFMRHFHMVPSSSKDIKVLSAIGFTADMMDLSDSFVAKTLVTLGLCAPRKAFPAAYLEYVDQSLMRPGLSIGGPSKESLMIKAHWDRIGEDRLAAFSRDIPHAEEPIGV